MNQVLILVIVLQVLAAVTSRAEAFPSLEDAKKVLTFVDTDSSDDKVDEPRTRLPLVCCVSAQVGSIVLTQPWCPNNKHRGYVQFGMRSRLGQKKRASGYVTLTHA